MCRISEGMDRHDDAPALPQRLRTTALLRRLDISRATLYRWLSDPAFPRPALVGSLRLYDAEAVERWLNAREGTPEPIPRLEAARLARATPEEHGG